MSWSDWPVYSDECREDVRKLLTDGRSLTAYRANRDYGVGPAEGSWAWKLEREAEAVHGVRHVIACPNGTVALSLMLQAVCARPRAIIVPALTFSATAAVLRLTGHAIVFADVSIPSCVMDRSSVTRMVDDDTMCMLPVDLFGRQAPEYISEIADSCQAVGLPPIARHGAWSFNGRKNVPAGEGGAVYTDSDDVATIIRMAVNHQENFGVEAVSVNARMPELTACLAYHGMREVLARNAVRQRLARVLNDVLKDQDLITPNPENHALYMYPLILPHGMPDVATRLRNLGVVCQAGYIQPPLHEYPAFRYCRRDALPNTESLSRDRLLLFPQVTPTATEDEMIDLGEKIKRCL